VSVPLGERDKTLRLAESILHEAMHLQLSLIERHAPIVGEETSKGYSPRQRRSRPILGVVHGLYVFACILRWLETLSDGGRLDMDHRGYVDRRRIEIAREIEQIAELPTSSALTLFGRGLSAWLITGSMADAKRISSAIAAAL
jgi:HEXXH motif-containing protein